MYIYMCVCVYIYIQTGLFQLFYYSTPYHGKTNYGCEIFNSNQGFYNDNLLKLKKI